MCGDCGFRLDEHAHTAARAPGSDASDDDDAWDDSDEDWDEEEAARNAASVREMRLLRATQLSKDSRALYVIPESVSRELTPLVERFGEVLVVTPRSALATVQARLRRSGLPGAVCLLGTDEQLPMARVDDPAERDDAVLTDNFFGRRETPSEEQRFTGDLLPEVPVSRIPTLDPMLVERLLLDAPSLCATWDGGFAISAAVWEGASRAVADSLFGEEGPRLLLSPPTDEATVRERLGDWPGRLYFNVHGSPQEPQWVGEGDGVYTSVLSLETVDVARRGIVVSESCYGAMSFPEDGGGIGERFLESGAGAFVGSTIIAWGPPVAPPGSADLIVLGFYRALDEGSTASEALLAAKRRILEEALEDDGGLSPPEHNTLLSFVHYGAPFARVASNAARRGGSPRAPSGVRGRALGSQGAGGGSVLDRVRGRLGGGSGGVIGQARGRMGARLEPKDWKVLSQGRVELARLSSEFRSYGEIQRSLRDLLGREPRDVSVRRYQAGQARRTHVASEVPAPWGGTKAAALLLDENERTLKRWVSR